MIRILTHGHSVLNARIAEDPRWSSAQRDAAKAAAEKDTRAGCRGLDAKMRPVICARFPGSNGESEYALQRNGAPTAVTKPLTERWFPKTRSTR